MATDPFELEHEIDRELSALPAPRAPRSLLPRVLNAVEREAARPWYTRAWRTWPVSWQLVSAAFAVAALVGSAALAPAAYAIVQGLEWNAHLPVPQSLAGVLQQFETAWRAAQVVWRVLLQPVVGFFAFFVLIMSAACIAFGAALDCVALGGASRS